MANVAEIVVKEILDSGVHFGHRTSKWNPKMRPYIYGRRNLIHIIDIKQTVTGLLRARAGAPPVPMPTQKRALTSAATILVIPVLP